MQLVTNYTIKQTVNTINCNDYMLRLNYAIKQNLVTYIIHNNLHIEFIIHKLHIL